MIVVILVLVVVLAMSLGLGVLVLVTQNTDDADKNNNNNNDKAADPQGPGTPAGSGTWNKAHATFYNSFPPCCVNSPTYDRNASKSECDRYSGCSYLGTFAAIGKKDYEWVKKNNIVAFFKSGQTSESWRRDWANKTLRLRNPATGKTLDVTVADTCGDQDCDGCCTKNAKGGTLIDLERFTAERFFQPGGIKGASDIEWQCLNCT
jgi:hypothetical protein